MWRGKSKEGWKGFIKLCSELDSTAEITRIFDLFFTIEEKETLASRYQIVKTLLEGKLPQREIADTYKVSIAQITRGSNALKIVPPKIKEILRSHLRDSS